MFAIDPCVDSIDVGVESVTPVDKVPKKKDTPYLHTMEVGV